MTSTLVLTVPRETWITENAREHWAVRAKKVKHLRRLAQMEARSQGLIKGCEVVSITAHITFPDNRQRDAHNATPVLKACIDGLVDYGLIPDDNDKHLIGPDPRAAGVTKGMYTVRLQITDLTVPF